MCRRRRFARICCRASGWEVCQVLLFIDIHKYDSSVVLFFLVSHIKCFNVVSYLHHRGLWLCIGSPPAQSHRAIIPSRRIPPPLHSPIAPPHPHLPNYSTAATSLQSYRRIIASPPIKPPHDRLRANQTATSHHPHRSDHRHSSDLGPGTFEQRRVLAARLVAIHQCLPTNQTAASSPPDQSNRRIISSRPIRS